MFIQSSSELITSIYRALEQDKLESAKRVLRSISASCPPTAIADVAPLYVCEGLAPSVVTCLKSLSKRARALDSLAIDESQRRCGSWKTRSISDWSSKKSKDLLRGELSLLRRRHRPLPEVMVTLLACHRDGYVRMAAVDALGKSGLDAFGLAITLVRCNDWVPQVRDSARRLIEAQAESFSAELIAQLLPLVLHLRSCTRVLHDETVRLCLQVLLAESGVAELERAARSSDAQMSGAAVEAARGLDDHLATDFFRGLLRHPMAKTRVVSFQALEERLDAQALLDLAIELMADSHGSIRQRALSRICKESPDNLESWLEKSIFDGNRTVQWMAIDHLKRRFGRDPVALIRAEIGEPTTSHLSACLEALGEHGGLEDVAIIRSFLNAACPRIRAKAIIALSKLESDVSGEVFMTALKDPEASVSCAAREILKKLPRTVPAQNLRELGLRAAATCSSQRFLASDAQVLARRTRDRHRSSRRFR